MRWALVRDDTQVVANVIEWDGIAPYVPPVGTTAIAAGAAVVGPGWLYDAATGTFIDPDAPDEP